MDQKQTEKWQKLQDFQNENKNLLIMIADPATDEISISYNSNNTFVRFPLESKEKGVVFNALRKSKFEKAIDPLMTGFTEATGISEQDADGNQLLHVLGGSVKALGVDSKGSKLEIIDKEKDK